MAYYNMSKQKGDEMNLYNFEFQKGKGLIAKIDEDELKELMEDEKCEQAEEMRREMDEEREDNRTELERGMYDSGMCESDFL